MKPAWIISASAAGALHAWLLFAVHPGTPAQALALGDDSSAVELSVVEAAPGEAAASVAEPAPAPAEPEPPQPAAEAVPPAPQPEPTPLPPIPEPEAEPLPPARAEPLSKERPQPAATPQSRVAPKTRAAAQPRSAAASSSAANANASTAGGTPGAGGRGGGATTKARYRSNPRPEYPAEARRARQQGTVLLAVEVTAEGRAGGVRLAQSSGFPLLDAAALQAVRRWTFEPARNLGLPVSSRVEVPVRFDLRQR